MNTFLTTAMALGVVFLLSANQPANAMPLEPLGPVYVSPQDQVTPVHRRYYRQYYGDPYYYYGPYYYRPYYYDGPKFRFHFGF